MQRAQIRHRDAFHKKVIILLLILITAAFVSALMMLSSNAGTAAAPEYMRMMSEAEELQMRYTSIHLQEGDTLRSIAGTYNNRRYCSDDEYIEAVKRVNRIGYDNIHPGCYLVVIEFSAEIPVI